MYRLGKAILFCAFVCFGVVGVIAQAWWEGDELDW